MAADLEISQNQPAVSLQCLILQQRLLFWQLAQMLLVHFVLVQMGYRVPVSEGGANGG